MEYNESNLPTTDNGPKRFRIPAESIVPGDDLYKWERTVAHISDLTWDAQQKLHERALSVVMVLLQHTHHTATDLREQIRQWQAQTADTASPSSDDLVLHVGLSPRSRGRRARTAGLDTHSVPPAPRRRTPVERAMAPLKRQRQLRKALAPKTAQKITQKIAQ